jgi:anti-sigma-K factor RskA
MEPERIDELIAGYALGALSADDERELEEHLRRSPDAREHLAALEETAATLAYGVETPLPPPRLRERILEQARPAPASNVVSLPRRRWLVPALATVAAAAAGVAIGLGIWGSDLSGSLSDEQAAAAKQSELIALFARPDASRYEVDGATGTLVVAQGGQAGLVLSGLGPAPAGKTYQAWVIEDDNVQSAGLFSGGNGQSVVPLTRPVPAGATVAVTIEQAGGADAPTQQPTIVAPTV